MLPGYRYGALYPSHLRKVLRSFDDHVLTWRAQKKYKKPNSMRKDRRWIQYMQEKYGNLLVHWYSLDAKGIYIPPSRHCFLQGNMGIGRTVVAVLALYVNVSSGHQGSCMVPTRILTCQHYTALMRWYLFGGSSRFVDHLDVGTGST